MESVPLARVRRWAANDYSVQDHLFLFIQTFLARDNEHNAIATRLRYFWFVAKTDGRRFELTWARTTAKSIPTHPIQSEILSFECVENGSAIISFTTKTPFHLIEAMPLSIIIFRTTHNINFRPLI